MKRRGFTLIELMGVIILISLLTVLVAPTVMNQISASKNKVSSATEKIIFSAAELYMANNASRYPKDTDGTNYCIQLAALVDAGLLESPIVDQVSGKTIDLDDYIKVMVQKDDADLVGEYVPSNQLIVETCN